MDKKDDPFLTGEERGFVMGRATPAAGKKGIAPDPRTGEPDVRGTGRLDYGRAWTYGPDPLGNLPLSIGPLRVVVQGGPFAVAPKDAFTVKLAMESRRPASIELDIRDFGVPDADALTRAICQTLDALAEGRQVYVGCGAGRGRTGLFLACIAKVVGALDPVSYVRAVYSERAVETKAQEQFVATFPVGRCRRHLVRLALRAWVQWVFSLTRE